MQETETKAAGATDWLAPLPPASPALPQPAKAGRTRLIIIASRTGIIFFNFYHPSLKYFSLLCILNHIFFHIPKQAYPTKKSCKHWCLQDFPNSPSWARTNNPAINSRVLYQRVRSHTDQSGITILSRVVFTAQIYYHVFVAFASTFLSFVKFCILCVTIHGSGMRCTAHSVRT